MNPLMSSSSTSHGYFDSVITQLSLSVGSSFEDVAGNSAANASEGVSAGVSAVDTGMALAGAFDAGMESAYVPALAGLGLKGMLHKALCTVTGHPVDVASGTFFTDEEDFFLTGVIPLSWERTWYSRSDNKGPLGNGWHHSYDMGLIVDEETLTFRMNDGRPVVIPLPTKQTNNPNIKRKNRDIYY